LKAFNCPGHGVYVQEIQMVVSITLLSVTITIQERKIAIFKYDLVELLKI